MTPAIRVRFMPDAVVSHPAFETLETPAAFLCLQLHVGAIAGTTVGIYIARRVQLERAARVAGERLDEALATLGEHGFIEFDAAAEVVRLPYWLAEYRPASVRSFTHVLGWLTHVPDCHARRVHLERLHHAAQSWGSRYLAALEQVHQRLVQAPRGSQLVLALPPVEIR